jgi:hypothetical protein
MDMQQFHVSIDGLDQYAFASQRVHQPDAAVTDRLSAIGEFKLNVACSKHGDVTILGFVFEPSLDFSFSCGDLLSCNLHPTLPRLPLPLDTL